MLLLQLHTVYTIGRGYALELFVYSNIIFLTQNTPLRYRTVCFLAPKKYWLLAQLEGLASASLELAQVLTLQVTGKTFPLHMLIQLFSDSR